jgi:cytochrome c oxidase subunit 2
VDVAAEGEDDGIAASERRALRRSNVVGSQLPDPRVRLSAREDRGENDHRDRRSGHEKARRSHASRLAANSVSPLRARLLRLGVVSFSVRKGIVQLVAIGVVIAGALTLVAVLFKWLPTSASEEFDRIQAIYWFVTIISIAIFSLVTAVVVFSVWKWRVSEDDDRDGPPIHGHTGLEILWTAVPAVLVTAIGIVSAVVLARNADEGDRPLQVEAIGQQFTWKFVYPEFDDLQTGELVLPVGRSAHFTMRAVDVLHSFWVPNFGQKMDAVPGIETEIVVTPDRMGEFAVVCTELCGLGHATMRAKARVVSEADFEAWIEEQGA